MRCGTFLLLAAALAASPGVASPFTFSYEGRLTDTTTGSVQGPVSLDVRFYNVATGTTPIGVSPQHFDGVALDDGVFQVDLTLSPAEYNMVFAPGADTYVEITDDTHSVTYPRQ